VKALTVVNLSEYYQALNALNVL